jgi:hypothetical protein
MSNEKHNDENESENTTAQVPEHRAAELRDLEERIAELRAQGILVGGDGPRESLRPIAHVPGALARFIEARG